jgi:hypothetical protein
MDGIHSTREHMKVSMDRIHASRERMNVSMDHIHASRERVHGTPRDARALAGRIHAFCGALRASAFRSAARRRRAGCSGEREHQLTLGTDQQGSCVVSASGHASASAKPMTAQESSDE